MMLLLDMSVAKENKSRCSVSWAERQQISMSLYLDSIRYILSL